MFNTNNNLLDSKFSSTITVASGVEAELLELVAPKDGSVLQLFANFSNAIAFWNSAGAYIQVLKDGSELIKYDSQTMDATLPVKIPLNFKHVSKISVRAFQTSGAPIDVWAILEAY